MDNMDNKGKFEGKFEDEFEDEFEFEDEYEDGYEDGYEDEDFSLPTNPSRKEVMDKYCKEYDAKKAHEEMAEGKNSEKR